MRLEGWNSIPDGYVARFELGGAPWWLRLWFRAPFLDRFAYPVTVRRGYASLTADCGRTPEQRGEVGVGWRVRPDDYRPPGSVAQYH